MERKSKIQILQPTWRVCLFKTVGLKIKSVCVEIKPSRSSPVQSSKFGVHRFEFGISVLSLKLTHNLLLTINN